MNYKFILALDPSGSFKEGKGTTGWCLFNAVDNLPIKIGDITAHNFDRMEAYWDAHIDLIIEMQKKYGDDLIVVIEDYFVYEQKADTHINSRMETSKLIGVLQHYCWYRGIPYKMQMAAEVKSRWSDEILHHKRFIVLKGRYYVLGTDTHKRVHNHMRDALRHAVHYATFKNQKGA